MYVYLYTKSLKTSVSLLPHCMPSAPIYSICLIGYCFSLRFQICCSLSKSYCASGKQIFLRKIPNKYGSTEILKNIKFGNISKQLLSNSMHSIAISLIVS